MRLTTICAVVFGLLLTAMTAVFAADAAVPDTGSLTALGHGMARLQLLKGSVEISGKGQLTVSAQATVIITGTEGTRTEKKNAKTGELASYEYKGFDGKATVTGENFSISLQSKEIKLTATGIGHAWLIGGGDYTLIVDDPAVKLDGKWTPRPPKAPAAAAAATTPATTPAAAPTTTTAPADTAAPATTTTPATTPTAAAAPAKPKPLTFGHFPEKQPKGGKGTHAKRNK
jgi:hypothetical protein